MRKEGREKGDRREAVEEGLYADVQRGRWGRGKREYAGGREWCKRVQGEDATMWEE